MAITFTGYRYLATANTAHMFYNTSLASQSFKLRVDSPSANFSGTINVLVRNIFDFVHSFWGSTASTSNLNLQLNGAGGTVQAMIPLTTGTVYVICLVWNGTAGVQTCYISGVPQVMGHISGLTTNRSDPIWLGPYAAQSSVVYTIGDYNAWDGYGLTQADAAYLTDNGDPATIGTSATWRCQWTLDGSTGQNAVIGDNGLKNAYGTGADFTTITGNGSAVYADPLIWAPTVTAHPYVTGCGKLIGTTFALNSDGSPIAPSQLLVTPTITVNGTNLGALTKPWFTGFHQCITWSTPNSVMINPGDTVSLNAPTAWANTPAGSVAEISGTIDNRSGSSSVQVENLTKTLRLGINNPFPSSLEYYPFRNAKFQMPNPYGYDKLHPGHGFQLVTQPCEAGLILVVWDATIPATPAMFSLQSNSPTRVTVTLRSEFSVSPSNGIGYVRVYEVAYIVGSDYETVSGGSVVGLNYDDPAFTGTPNYDNLWIYLAGEWDIVNGAPVFDRSDRFALSQIYQDRVNGVGSMRAVDMTACGGACETFPYPESLNSPNDEFFWGYNPTVYPNVGFTSIGPVDVTATPYIYSAQFRQVANLFSATLSSAVTTAPAPGTNETWHFSDGATAPLMAGLEIQVDAEIVRILSGSGTNWLVYRGSNGTTPATHSPGTVTVYGRQPISLKVHTDGTAPYTAPAFMQCNSPHGLTTRQGYYPQGAINITMADGTVANNFGLSSCYVTGPTTFVSIWPGYYVNKPSGTKPSTTYVLNPSTNYLQRIYFPRMPLQVYMDMVSRFPEANLHINVPLDACNDMVYKYAWLCRDTFPSGRKIYVEWANEPWNWAPPFQTNLYCNEMGSLSMPASFNTYSLAYYAYRAAQVHAIFRSVFTAAGRSSEILGVINCQMNSGSSQVTPHLNLGLTVGQPFDAVMCAPYYSMGMSGNGLAATVTAFNQYDNDQAAEQLLHDITYDPTGMTGWINNITDAIAAYNKTNNKSCILIGYEGGIEYAAPTGAINRDTRSHDIQYNPNFYNVEQGWFKILQDTGFDHLHIYGLGIGWPASWGIYHDRTQKHSRGDGINGAYDNRTATITPGTSGYIGGSTVKQDRRVDSVRGQALRDWLDALSTLPATAYTFTGPTTGLINMVSDYFVISPNGVFAGTVTIGVSGGGLSTSVVLTFTGSASSQRFTIDPIAAGDVTLTPTNSGALTDPVSLTYTVTSPSPASVHYFVNPWEARSIPVIVIRNFS